MNKIIKTVGKNITFIGGMVFSLLLFVFVVWIYNRSKENPEEYFEKNYTILNNIVHKNGETIMDTEVVSGTNMNMENEG